MNENDFLASWSAVMKKLGDLDKNLTYHNINHTKDVFRQCIRIAEAEGITDLRQIFQLKYAALFHDIGFLHIYAGHEIKSCEMFLEDTRHLNIPQEDNNVITAIIMATRLPQEPHTLLERIICDADLDYLGRDDFFDVADNLQKEFLHFKIVKDEVEWDNRQIEFLEHHKYHTASNAAFRDLLKHKHLEAISD